MNEAMIWYAAAEENGDRNSDLAVMVSRIVRLSKDWDLDITFIHLDTGEILRSADSMKTLRARINDAAATRGGEGE